jgi:hypothetical protein
VLARFASHAAPEDPGASPEFPRTPNQLRGTLQDLFNNDPPPEDSEAEPPVYTLSEEELETYKAHLPSHLTADTYNTFKNSSTHKAVMATIRSRGGTESDIQGFEYLILDPDMVCAVIVWGGLC